MWGYFGALSKVSSEDCERLAWMEIAGWSFYALTLLSVVVVMIWIVIRQAEYGFVRKLSNSVVTDRNWGPNDTVLHAVWKRSTQRKVSCVSPQCGEKLENAFAQKKWQSYSNDLNTAHVGRELENNRETKQCSGLTNRSNRHPRDNNNHAFHF